LRLLYKEDWEEIKARYAAWWAHENHGRCGMWVTAPRDGFPPADPPKVPESLTARWTDLDYISAVNAHDLPRTFYGGEAFPIWQGRYPGNKSIPVFLGCPVELREDTGWVSPILTGENIDYHTLKLDEQNPHYQHALALQRRAIAESQGGKAIPAFSCAMGGCGDSLAGIRGVERLLFDLVYRPEQVREAELFLMNLWCEIYDTFYAMFHEAAEGSTSWFPLWSPGKAYATHCDFAYNISPKDFTELFLPAIEMQCRFLDHSIHHLDGEGNFVHADALCEVEDLNAIQVLPGAGKPSPLHYMPLLKKIQSKGKNLHITIPPQDVETALTELSARGLFIHTWCDTEAEARALLQKAEKLSHDKISL
jgi:hypothetical protein